MVRNKGICNICDKPTEDCICCSGCSHICSLDYGELYCPVCFPEKNGQQMNRNDEFFMQLALKEAETAYSEDEVPVGAVLVLEDKIIASTRNKKEASNDPTAHAELTAIMEGTRMLNDWRLTDVTMYVTKEPCVMCAGAMINARLGKLVYGCRDSRYGAVDSQYRLLTDTELNHEVEVISGVLGSECAEILKTFFRMRR